MIKYPSILPGPLLAGYALNQKPNLIRSEIDTGIAFSRVKFKNVPTIIPSTWLFTAEQAATFEGFIEYELLGGLLWFTMQIKTPFGIQIGKLRFVDDPRDNCSPSSIKNWQYKANIELKVRPSLAQ